WDNLEVFQRLLAPAQEAVALLVALELDPPVDVQRVRTAEDVDLHRMVDDQFGGDLRVDLARLAAQPGDGIPHRGEIDHARHAGEVLQHHARWHEGDFARGFRLRVPLRDRLDMFRAYGKTAVL